MVPQEKQDLRRWVENHRVAADLEREVVRSRGAFVPDPIAAAFSLIATTRRLYGWPVPEDAVTRREDEHSQQQWVRLRRALGSR